MPDAPTCAQCAYFDVAPDTQAGFCELDMSYRPGDSQACAGFVPAQAVAGDVPDAFSSR